MTRNVSAPFLLLAFLLFILSSLSPVFAGGKRDPVFGDADDFIKQKAYTDAIIELIRITREDSLQFDNMQKRIRKLLRSSNRYTEVAAELLNLLESDPNNIERIFQLSEELDTLGEARSEEARQFITRIQEIARYTVYRNQLESILVRARERLDAGDYLGAYNIYLTGFPVYQGAFTASNYPYSVKAAMTTLLATIAETGPVFAQRSQNITPSAVQAAAISDNPANSQEQLRTVANAFNRVRPELEQLTRLKERIWDIRDQYREFSEIENKSEGRYYIAFGGLLINGRPDENVREGLLGAIEGLWRSAAGPLEGLTERAAGRLFFDSALPALKSDTFSQARDVINQTESGLEGARNLFTMLEAFNMRDDPGEHEIFGTQVAGIFAPFSLFMETVNRAVPELATASNFGGAFSAAAAQMLSPENLIIYREGRITASEAIAYEQNLRESLDSIGDNLEALIADLETNLETVRLVEAAVSNGEQSLRYFNDTLEYARSLGGNIFTLELASLQRQYTIENENFAANYPAMREAFETAQSLVTGIEKTLPDGQTYISRDPAGAASILEDLNARLDTSVSDGQALLTRYAAEEDEMRRTNEIETLESWSETQLSRYIALREQGGTLEQNARSVIAEAQTRREAGENLFAESGRVLAREDFDDARRALAEADMRYESAFDLQDSDELRQDWNARRTALAEEIRHLEALKITREVNELVEKSQPEFYNGNYQIAEDLLITAQNIWEKIDDEDHPDIRHWLTLVRNALTLRTGRTIPFTAPLYPEMSQLLSAATLNFNEGLGLLQNGRRQEAIQYFNQAREKTQTVKLLFPINYDAGILELRIDQIEDPQLFNSLFQQRLTRAISGTKEADLQAFAELQYLAEINPNYRNMDAIIVQAEVDMGLRPPPPNEAAIARSRELTRSAQNMISGGDRVNLEIAREQLHEALRENPENATAITELDRVERMMGLAAQSEREAQIDPEYQRAVRELLAGNKLIAYSIVRQVLSREEYQNSSRFLELLQRIESIL